MSDRALLNGKGLFVPEATLQKIYAAELARLFSRLTLTFRPRVGVPKKVVLYERLQRPGKQILVRLPRGYICELVARGVAVINTLQAVQCKIPALLCELFPNQTLILDYLMERAFTPARITEGTACALLNLRAGMGKTFVAAGLVARLQLRTLYVVPSVILAEQATKDFKGCFASGVCWLQTGAVRLAEEFVTVVVVNTALKQPPAFFAEYGLVIYDEVHTYCTDKRAAIFRRCCPVAFGMSATTDNRNDTFDMISHAELTGDLEGGRIYVPSVTYAEQIPSFTYDDVHFDTLVTVIKYNGPPRLTQTLKHPSTDKMFTPWMHEQFLRDPERTAVAVKAIRELYDWRDGDKQHRIFVFCEEREPLKMLYGLLRQSFEVDAPELCERLDEETGQFIGGIKPQEIVRCKTQARLLLTTYGYSSTGVSIAEMTACVFWTSRRSNMLQILSRILRRSGDQSIRRRVIDIVDNRTPMRSQYYERRNAYTYFGMDIEVCKVGE